MIDTGDIVSLQMHTKTALYYLWKYLITKQTLWLSHHCPMAVHIDGLFRFQLSPDMLVGFR